jgi:hypothetical protein
MMVKIPKNHLFYKVKFIWDIIDKKIQVLRLLPDKMYGHLHFNYG